MDRSLELRTFALIGAVLACLGLLAPTWPGTDALPSWFPFKKQISLGLDLQGGLHIVYAIDLDKAVDDKASEIKRDLDARFADEKLDKELGAKVKTPAPRTTPTEIPLGAVIVTMTDGKRKAEIESQIQSDHRGVVEPFECGADAGPNPICFKVSQAFAESTKKAALTNAVATIRERINEKGVAEPSVVEKGDSIIVELPGDPDSQAMKDTREIIARTAKLEFKVVDDSTECLANPDPRSQDTAPNCYPVRLFRKVGSDKDNKATDPRARALDILAEVSQWHPEQGGGQRTEHYLRTYDREESVPVAWATKHGCKKVTTQVEDGKVKCIVTGRQALERYLFGDPLLNETGVTAILDWEGAHLGDPIEDLGWLCVKSWRFGAIDKPAGGFGSRAELWSAYEQAGGAEVDPARAHWWEVLGTARWGIICHTQAWRHLSGAVKSMELASIGRRAVETEVDLLQLLKQGA